MRDKVFAKELTIAIHTPGNDDFDFSEAERQIAEYGNFSALDMTQEEKETMNSHNEIKKILKDVY